MSIRGIVNVLENMVFEEGVIWLRGIEEGLTEEEAWIGEGILVVGKKAPGGD